MRSTHRTAPRRIAIPWILTLLACLLLLCMPAAVSAKTKAEPFQVTLSPTLKSIRVSWPAQKKAAKYVIYRAVDDSEDIEEARIPTLAEYKKIKTLKAKSRKKTIRWTDKKVKDGKYYAYVVKAFDKGGTEIACTFEDEFSVCYARRGLGRPLIFNNGYGENYSNTPKALFLYIDQDPYAANVRKAKVVIYRKADGEKKYKKLATVKMKGKETVVEYTDKTVKPGTTYSYKTRIIKKVGRKTYKSRLSRPLTIPAVNIRVTYKVTCMTPSGTYTDRDKLEITLSLQNQGKYNGVTSILPAVGDFYDAEYYSKDKSGKSGVYNFRFTMYSRDNKTWTPLSPKAVDLPKEAPLYLKGEILRGDADAIYFGGNDKNWEYSYIDSEGGLFHYYGSGVGYTSSSLNLKAGTGSSYMEWD